MKVAVVQTALDWHDPAANRRRFDAWFEQVEPGTELVVLPEMFSTGFTMDSREVAETMDGPTVAWLRERAASLGAVLAGSVVIREGERWFNRLVWMPPDGTATTYDKRHRFRMAGEHEHYDAGHERVVVAHGAWRVCPLVCYDLRFPVWSRNRGDYDVLIYPANWPAARQAHWNGLLRARAIENQCYVVGVNRVGEDGNGVVYRGGTAVYDFEGNPVVEVFDAERIAHVELDRVALDGYRAAFPAWRDADDFELGV